MKQIFKLVKECFYLKRERILGAAQCSELVEPFTRISRFMLKLCPEEIEHLFSTFGHHSAVDGKLQTGSALVLGTWKSHSLLSCSLFSVKLKTQNKLVRLVQLSNNQKITSSRTLRKSLTHTFNAIAPFVLFEDGQYLDSFSFSNNAVDRYNSANVRNRTVHLWFRKQLLYHNIRSLLS